MHTFSVSEGKFHIYRLFEVAQEIQPHVLTTLGTRAGFVIQPNKITLLYQMPRLSSVFLLGQISLPLPSFVQQTVDLQISFFDFGVASVCFNVPIRPGTRPAELSELVRVVSNSSEILQIAKTELDRVLAKIQDALVKPHRWDEVETYHVLYIRQLGESMPLNQLLQSPELVRILQGEDQSFTPSDQLIEYLGRRNFSYSSTDICVIDWDTTILIDPNPTSEIPDLLELTMTQLLEFRHYDTILERQILDLYDRIQKKRTWFDFLRIGRTRRLTKEVHQLMLETAEFVERSENAIKVVGDSYNARVYRAAMERFFIPVWQGGVLRKQSLVGQVAQMLNGESVTSVSTFLEVTIVILILAEILMAFVK